MKLCGSTGHGRGCGRGRGPGKSSGHSQNNNKNVGNSLNKLVSQISVIGKSYTTGTDASTPGETTSQDNKKEIKGAGLLLGGQESS